MALDNFIFEYNVMHAAHSSQRMWRMCPCFHGHGPEAAWCTGHVAWRARCWGDVGMACSDYQESQTVSHHAWSLLACVSSHFWMLLMLSSLGTWCLFATWSSNQGHGPLALKGVRPLTWLWWSQPVANAFQRFLKPQSAQPIEYSVISDRRSTTNT